MKTQSCTILFLALVSVVAMADEATKIEVESIKFLSDAPSKDEIVRMLDSFQLRDPSEIAAVANAGGNFNVDKTKIFRFEEFDHDGKSLGLETRSLGCALSGTAKENGSRFEVTLEYSEATKKGDIILKTETGLGIARPVFSLYKAATSFTVELGRWILLDLPGDSRGGKSYLAVRLTKTTNGEQTGADQPATRDASKSEGNEKSESESKARPR